MSRVRCIMRNAVDNDVHYIIKSWLENYRNVQARGFPRPPACIYYPHQRKLVVDIVQKEPCIIACNPDDATHIIGFACGRQEKHAMVVHFVYVKRIFRGFGIGDALLRALGWDGKGYICASQWTAAAEELRHKYPVVYHPYLAYDDTAHIPNIGAAEEARARAAAEELAAHRLPGYRAEGARATVGSPEK